MENYKKKSLNFMGLSRDLRKIDRDNLRCTSRLKRLSTIRCVEDEIITEEKKENGSKVPTMGKSQPDSRLEMLQKWKQEKLVKKQRESRLKKPVFKCGVSKPQPLFALDTPSRLYKARFHNAESHIRSNMKTTMKKASNSQPSKKAEVAMNILKPSTKASNSQPSKKAEVAMNILKPSTKASNSQPSKKAEVAMNILKPSTKDLKVPVKSKMVLASKPEIKSIRNKDSRLQPLSARLKVNPTGIASVKSSIPSSGLPKPKTSRTLNKVQTSIPKTNGSKIPREKSNDENISDKKTKNIPKFPRTTACQQQGNISEKSGKSETKVPNKPVDVSPTLECNLSHNEPVKEQRKSFAPEGFMFQPPAYLNSSLFLEDGLTAIFMRMRNRILRASTPKRSSSGNESSPQIKGAEFLEEEKGQLTKNADKDLEPLNDIKPNNYKQSLKFEFPEADSTQDQKDIVFSSEGIYPDSEAIKINTNDVHSNITLRSPILSDLVVSDKTTVLEGRLLSSKIVLSDFKLAAKPVPSEPINSHNLHNSEACETNSVVIGPSGAVDPPVVSDLVKSDITPALEDMFLSSNIAHPELALKTEPDPAACINSPILLGSVALEKKSSDGGLTKVVDTSILSDLEETGKMEANSTNTYLADDSNDSVFFNADDSNDSVFFNGDNVFVGDKVVLSEQSKYNSNGFLQKLENNNKSSLKPRNFQRREKPVLMSINESLENTPKSAIKKKFPESGFTPRRSLRLAKLSGNFSSLDNLLDSPKPKTQDKTCGKEGFIPRRSTRLSKFSIDFHSDENLFNVGRPTLFESPEEDRLPPKLLSKVTYDFDRLSMEKEGCRASFGSK